MIRVQSAGRYILATVLVLSAGAKLADIPAFVQSVMVLGGVARPLAGPVVAMVLFLEIVLGVILFTGHRPKMAIISAAGLLLAFAAVLTTAVLREIAGTCGCFGSLGPHLPYRYQALGDIALAAGALAIAGEPPRLRAHWLHAILGMWCALLILVPPPAGDQGGGNNPQAVRERDEGKVRVLLFADFSDFGCQVCLEDFLALCDSLDVRTASGGVPVRLIARRDSSRGEGAQKRFLAGWAKGNGYRFPVEVDSAGIFAGRGVERTSVIIERENGEIISRGSVPLGRERRSEILSLLGRPGVVAGWNRD